MTDIHTQIQAFLSSQSHFSAGDDAVTKAGIIPYIEFGESKLYMAMRPLAKRPELGLPEFQLCKGTRMFFDGTEWHDMKAGKTSGQLEQLAVTALREGVEELGLVVGNISHMRECGVVNFTSVSTQKPIPTMMFMAKLRDKEQFMPIETIADTTAERQFFTLEAFRRIARPDHAHVLDSIVKNG